MDRTDKAALASEIIVEALVKKKEELQMTCAQIAEKSGVAESTVIKVFNRSIKSPSIDTLCPIADAVDLSIDKALNKAVNTVVESAVNAKTVPATMLVNQEDKFLNLFLETHNRQITDLKEQNRHKEKWIRSLVGLLVFMTMILAGLLIYVILIHELEPTEISTADMKDAIVSIKHIIYRL